MKLKGIWFIGSCLLMLLSQLSFAEPLINSAFARANPGVIPYSKCVFENFSASHAAILVGGAPDKNLVLLNCYSAKHKIYAKIPLRITNILRAGLGVGFNAGVSIDAAVTGLHGKNIGQLLGSFSGIVGNYLGLGVIGSELQLLDNAAGIGITAAAIIAGLDFTLVSYSRLKLSVSTSIKRTRRYRSNSEVLYGKTVYEHHLGGSYLSAENLGMPNSRVMLKVADGSITLSEGSALTINELNYGDIKPRLKSEAGEKIHLVSAVGGMSNSRVIIERENGSWAYHTLEGVFEFREPNELVPNVYELQELKFVQDDYQEDAAARN